MALVDVNYKKKNLKGYVQTVDCIQIYFESVNSLKPRESDFWHMYIVSRL